MNSGDTELPVMNLTYVLHLKAPVSDTIELPSEVADLLLVGNGPHTFNFQHKGRVCQVLAERKERGRCFLTDGWEFFASDVCHAQANTLLVFTHRGGLTFRVLQLHECTFDPVPNCNLFYEMRNPFADASPSLEPPEVSFKVRSVDASHFERVYMPPEFVDGAGLSDVHTMAIVPPPPDPPIEVKLIHGLNRSYWEGEAWTELCRKQHLVIGDHLGFLFRPALAYNGLKVVKVAHIPRRLITCLVRR